MQLWEDGLIAMLAAVGLASLMWAVVRTVAFPAPGGRCRTVAVVPVSGDGAELEAQIRFLVQLRAERGAFGRIVMVDCGLDEGGRRTAGLLAKGDRGIALCGKAEIDQYIP